MTAESCLTPDLDSHGPYFGKSRRLTHIIVAHVIFSVLWHMGLILLHWNTWASFLHFFSPPPPLLHFPFFFSFFFNLLATFLLHIYTWHSRTAISCADKRPQFLEEMKSFLLLQSSTAGETWPWDFLEPQFPHLQNGDSHFRHLPSSQDCCEIQIR